MRSTPYLGVQYKLAGTKYNFFFFNFFLALETDLRTSPSDPKLDFD